MKQLLSILFTLALINSAQSQIPHSTIKAYAGYICNCIDTVDIKQPEEDMKKQFSFCRSIALTVILNDRLIGPESLSDEKWMEEFNKKSLGYLSDSCDAIHRLARSYKIEPEPDNANELFTPVSFFESKGLKKGEVNKLLHVYNNFTDARPKFQRVVDIRWTFKTEADALKWHAANIELNSEGGAPVKERMDLPGAQELKVYREGPGAAEMMKAMGIPQKHHYFIFVYKNIASKVFVATDESTTTAEALIFAEAAMAQLKTAVR